MNKKLPQSLTDAWAEAERTGSADIGRTVVCDICDEDYTDSTETGGFIFSSKAYCPVCAIEGMASIKKYHEEHFIRATCPDGKSFADFVRDYRGGNSRIVITRGKP